MPASLYVMKKSICAQNVISLLKKDRIKTKFIDLVNQEYK